MSDLTGKIDTIIDLLIDGETYRSIAKLMDTSTSSLFRYMSLPEHSARVKTALALSAQMYAEKAEESLIKAESNMPEMQRARELAQHYRWAASKRDPKTFGDKLELSANVKSAAVRVIMGKDPEKEDAED